MKVYEVVTDLDPEQLTEVAVETYRQWLEFALGKGTIGGKTLAHPSGRYAAALSWKQTGEGEIAIIADEDKAPEAGWIEEGRSGADIKAAMLDGGKVGANGKRYRDIPIRPDSAPPVLSDAGLESALGVGHLPSNPGRMWAKPRWFIDPNAHWVRMSEDSKGWQVPAMPAYSPAAILASLLRSDLKAFMK